MEKVLSLIMEFKYVMLFPLSIAEGPVITIIAGLLCQSGLLSFKYVIPILIAGDLIGDTFYFMLGRWSNRPVVGNFARRIGLSAEKIAAAKKIFVDHPVKSILFSKIILGVGVLGLVVAGSTGFSLQRFLTLCIPVTLAQSAVYLSIGFFCGNLLQTINHYMNWFAGLTVIIFLLSFLVIGLRSLKKSL
jgi:membrane-associated protein